MSRSTSQAAIALPPFRHFAATPNIYQGVTLLQDKQNGFGFARSNPRPAKPRTKGITEIRGPYYSVMGKRYLADILETYYSAMSQLLIKWHLTISRMGDHVDGLKFAGGAFSLLHEKPLRELVDLAHEHGVYISTGGWAEHLLTHPDPDTVFDRYLKKCKDLGLDVVELSSGFLSFPEDDWLRLIDKVHSYKLEPKPELGIQFGAGGDTPASGLESIGTSDPGKLVNLGRRFLDAGVKRLMIESEGITENVKSWRTDVVSKIMKELPPERVMFEAADPKVFNWYVREFGIDVNLFVDHSQIVQLECLRTGIWGTADTWGKIRHKESECHFSDRPARLLKPDAKDSTVLLSERMVASPQRETAMDRLLNSLEDQGMNMERQEKDEKEGTAPVPKVARLLRDGQGKFMYIGDSASLSFLQSLRRVVTSSIGRCEFTEDNSRHSMLEAFQSNPSTQPGALVAPPSNEEAQRLAGQFVLATSPLLDLFDLEEFHPRLANWVANPSGDEDTVSSIFYLVLAIGAQVSDIDQTVAEQYFGSGRQLAFSAFQETPSISTIQSYILVSMYMLGACRRNGAFMNLGIALRAAYAVGIHRKDANALFCGRERRARERVWKSLRMMDLFLSASLGRPPATSDYDYDTREDALVSGESQHHLTAEQQLSAAVISLCRIFERILTDVYMKQVISINVAETISNQHRAWVRILPTILRMQTERLEKKSMENSLAAAHVFGSYYWSIILLTRPFLIYRVAQYVKGKSDSSSDTRNGSSRISLFADACVYSALRGLDMVDDLSHYTSLPRRLPFLINSVFNSVIVLGAAFFADYDNLLPLEEGMNKAERFLGLFVPHDPHACRFFQIIKYLRAAVTEYVCRRNRQWMNRRSKQVDQLFGQVGGDEDRNSPTPGAPLFAGPSDAHSSASATAISPTSADKMPIGTPISYIPSQPLLQPQLSTDNDVWEALCNGSDPTTALSYDAAISALTTSGIPVGCSPGGTIPSGPLPVSGPSPISDMMFPDNGLLYMAEDLPVFGIWGDEP
ncbi:Aldolase-type TIM barrel [Penicillium expansum]|uniref:Aldolase-type TIM barrel n=1 Tax=Penicillium expansum TaxID=27334 RepID=A0A0A2ILC9_PENEN|nr:Aldolase-type TIM barrel [Penicillium expansum]KGO43228.1 Aldolase-type TIM barrel [Penicillium expansum]KGO45833.1 Aldolase-type TIM barrel [Penicillium expansum]KGO57876.1 Aldolase-type TIM barrel [Penicillium expansum]